MLVAMPRAPSSFLFLVVRPGGPSGGLAPSKEAVTMFQHFSPQDVCRSPSSAAAAAAAASMRSERASGGGVDGRVRIGGDWCE